MEKLESEDDLLLYKIALSLIPGIGHVTAKSLVAYCGGAREALMEKEKVLRTIPGIGILLARNIVNARVLDRAGRELEFMKKHGVRALFYLDEAYPARLKVCVDAPVILFTRGTPDFNCAKVVSIVGTRSVTPIGKQLVDRLIADLAERHKGVMIVSGLAYGVDIQAHRSALKYGIPTVSVLAHGLETIYPPLHEHVANEMCGKQGGLVSDFFSYSVIDRKNFLRRNRIIAGMADAIVVAESAKKGGGMVTASIACSYNRDLFAFPGRVGDIYSEGCNFLIKSNRAALIESVADLEYVMNWQPGKSTPDGYQPRLFDDLTTEGLAIVSLLREKGELPIDEICSRSGYGMNRVSPLLLELEFAGVVSCFPGKMFRIAR